LYFNQFRCDQVGLGYLFEISPVAAKSASYQRQCLVNQPVSMLVHWLIPSAERKNSEPFTVKVVGWMPVPCRCFSSVLTFSKG
jgi:hypothetical protein